MNTFSYLRHMCKASNHPIPANKKEQKPHSQLVSGIIPQNLAETNNNIISLHTPLQNNKVANLWFQQPKKAHHVTESTSTSFIEDNSP